MASHRTRAYYINCKGCKAFFCDKKRNDKENHEKASPVVIETRQHGSSRAQEEPVNIDPVIEE